MPSDSDRAPAVYVDDVWVSFRVTREKNQTLKGTIASLRDRSKRAMLIEALRGVSFQVPAGSVYGVIGRNGAGKSTFLKIAAGVTQPSEGSIDRPERIAPLIEVGAGFHPELTGRGNILLGGLTAGLTASRCTPTSPPSRSLRARATRSTSDAHVLVGHVRTAGSVAAHLRPEILLIDEALAAGDAAFKQKSMEKITELCEQQDCTVLIVSHGLEVVKALAEGCVWLDRGLVRMQGTADDVVAAYMDEEHIEATSATALEDV